MRWPFGPPHLTLKTSKQNKQNTKTKEAKQPLTKKTKKHRKQEAKKAPKTAKIPKNSFSVISQIFAFFLVAFQNFPLLTPWPKKRAPKKHYKNRCLRHIFLKSRCASRNGHSWTKKTKIHKFQLSFFCLVVFSFNNPKAQKLLKPLFL